MDVQTSPLSMAQKLVPQTDTLMRPFYQTGHFHHHKVFTPAGHNPQHRLNRGEGIIGDLRLGSRAMGNQRGFTRVGLGQKAHVRQEFQLQKQYYRLPILSLLR